MPPVTPPTGSRPLGLPVGSVRAIIVLSLLFAVEVIALAFVVRVVFGSNEELIQRSLELVLTALIGLANLAVGYYVGTRQNEGTGD